MHYFAGGNGRTKTVDCCLQQRDCPPTSQWSVVQEDFMLGREKLKGWDKVKIVFHQEHRKIGLGP
jgi:hypothetical protein